MSASRCDVFFTHPARSPSACSPPPPATNDYAISPREFHWEEPSLTREASSTGQRLYPHRASAASRCWLLCGSENRRGGLTLRFCASAFPTRERHERRPPMADSLRLQLGPIPGLLSAAGGGM